MRSSLVAFLVVLISGSLLSQKLTNDERTILMLRDQRSLADGRLVSYLSHPKKSLRIAAAVALANIQDTSTVGFLFPLLNDREYEVRQATAFAIGQIGLRSSETELFEALRKEKQPEVQSRILEAIGKIGERNVLDSLVAFASGKRVLLPKKDLALSIARFALRGIKTESSVWYCFDLLKIVSHDVQWSALHALWRSAPNRLIDIEIAKRKTSLESFVTSRSADVRMNLATLLGRANCSEANDVLLALDKKERAQGDWRVQVQIVRSLVALAATHSEMLDPIPLYLESRNDHVRIATLQALSTLSPEVLLQSPARHEILDKVQRLASEDHPSAEMVQGEAFVALGKHAPELLAKQTYLLAGQSLSLRLKSKLIEGMSQHVSVENFRVVMQYLDDDSIRTTMAAWDFLKRITTPVGLRTLQADTVLWKELPRLLGDKMKRALDKRDMAVTTVVANAFGDTSFFQMFRSAAMSEIVLQEFVAAYRLLKSPGDVEAMQAVLETLGKIGNTSVVPTIQPALRDPDRTVAVAAAVALKNLTGKDYSSEVPPATKPLYTDYDWKTLDAIKNNQLAEIKTTKGSIVLQLTKGDAPFTVLSFVKLVKKGFYNGLNFHRVVPNFVIQGGDPRGDGWGGPGYAIRSEFSLINFERGSCGIASAGKDTEGCQFFITHSPTPHLDGRYTIFGKVVKGMDVVDKIQVGDRILSMQLK